jgi:predicted transcriptional regulator
MARVGLRLSRAKLSKLAEVSETTIADFEAGRRVPYDRTVRDIRDALERLGATFLNADKKGAGVRIHEC